MTCLRDLVEGTWSKQAAEMRLRYGERGSKTLRKHKEECASLWGLEPCYTLGFVLGDSVPNYCGAQGRKVGFPHLFRRHSGLLDHKNLSKLV